MSLQNAKLSTSIAHVLNEESPLHCWTIHRQLGPCDNWIMTAVYWKDGLRIHAGCRWFTLEEAREHWGPKCEDRRAHGDLMLAGVEALFSLARAHGWEGC